ncbi:MAG: lysine-2,3-aminomutase-like protein [Alphaproteobacteria bacterium]|nr:lysine-2,3-aminomutase-like protein [Alphaproteobacteria bacterium]
MAEKTVLKSPADFENRPHVVPSDLAAIALVAKRYAVGVTPHVMSTIQGSPQDDPVARQYIPQKEELLVLPEESPDPIGDDAHSPVKGIVHRYPDRVLLKIANVCAVYCRYCFRREMVGPGSATLKPAELEAALNYIRNDSNIFEIILTGGDPLVLSPKKLSKILDDLCAIPHVQVIRIHSRVPVADPARITTELCAALDREKAVYMAIHINHTNEITPDVKAVFKALHKAGCVLLSQSVLLKGINDNTQALENLFRTLVSLRVKPYYLHHPDLAPGTSHFRLPVHEGQALMASLQGRISGLCLPHYMLDIPGGHGKVPIGPSWLEETQNGTYLVKDRHGHTHAYPPENKE